MGRGPIVATAVALVVLLVVGCGGDSSDGPAISKEAFIKQADAICQRGNKRLEVALADFLKQQKSFKRFSKGDYEELIPTVFIPSFTREIKEIRALGIPNGDEEKIEAMLSALEEGLETAESDPKLASTNSEAVFGISSRIANEYGLKVCGTR